MEQQIAIKEDNQELVGFVNVSGVYFSHSALDWVVCLTFIKAENEDNGYGISKEFPAGPHTNIDDEFVSVFIQRVKDML